jgi:hypothetical protein
MKVHWTDVAIATVMLAAGSAVVFAGLARVIRRAVAERQLETDRHLNALAMTVKALQARVAELGASEQARAPRADADAVAGVAENMAGADAEEIKPETAAVIAAAVTTFLDKKARIRSAKPLAAEQNGAGAWAQQGRVIVQTSHNLRPRV